MEEKNLFITQFPSQKHLKTIVGSLKHPFNLSKKFKINMDSINFLNEICPLKQWEFQRTSPMKFFSLNAIQ
jgi:hypothetical protein